MSSSFSLALFALVAFVVFKLFFARSESTESLKVRAITPKRSSTVASAMEESLRAPAPDVSLLVVGAQQLSISDPTAEVDDLISALSSLSMEAPPLKSCLKGSRSSTSRPRRVHFQTPANVRLIEVVSPGKLQTMRRANPTNLRPHIPGVKFYDSRPNGDFWLHKADGIFNPPRPSRVSRPRCQTARLDGICYLCPPPSHMNVLVVDRVDSDPVRVPWNWPAGVPYYT